MTTKSTPLINALNAGELTPLIDARVDINKYYKGCITLQNFIPLVEGGVKRMPGTYFVLGTKYNTKKSRLVPFHFSTEQAYHLEFGEYYIRFFKNHGLITVDDSMPDFDPALSYYLSQYAKVGCYRSLNAGGGNKYLYVSSPYEQTGATAIKVACESNTIDTMTVNNNYVTATKVPTGDYGSTTWYTWYEASYYLCVDDAVGAPDDWSTFIYTYEDNSTPYCMFTHTAFTVPGGSTNITITVRSRAAAFNENWPTIKEVLLVGGNYYDMPTNDHFLATTFGDFYYTWSLNPKTGVAWTVDDVNGIGANALTGFGVRRTTGIDRGDVAVTQVYIEIKYATAADDTITIKLANSTPAKNSANLIQAAIRALGIIKGVNLSEWCVTENRFYALSRPTTGVSIAASAMTSNQKIYQCIAEISATGYNTSNFPVVETTTWDQVTIGDPVEIETPYEEADLFNLDLRTQAGDILYIFHGSYAPMKLTRYSHVLWELTEMDCVSSTAKPISNITNANPGSVTSEDHGLMTGDYIFIVGVEGMVEVNNIRFQITKVDADTITIGIDTTSYGSYISGGEFTPGITGITKANPAVVTMPRHGFANGDRIKIIGVQGMTELNNRVFTVANRANTTFELYGEDSSSYGTYTGGGTGKKRIFAETGSYPSCGTFFEQRLCVGGFESEPQKIALSVVADWENFTQNPNAEDYAVEFTLVSDRIDKIRWLIGQEFLMSGTPGGVWRIGATNSSEPISAINILAKKQTTLGASNIIPVVIADSILWVTRSKRSVRRLIYTMEQDKWIAPDMTRVSSHITLGETEALSGIVDMVFQADPTPILWAVRKDGQLLGLTYEMAEDVYSWFRVVTDGEIESVSVSNEDDQEDEIWIVVKRIIGGSVKRYIEYFKPQAFFSNIKDGFFVHSGLTWDGGDGVSITNITKANPAVVTAPGHTFTNGMKVRITGVEGMTQINSPDYDSFYAVANPIGNTFELSGVNSIDYGAYASGGIAERITNVLSGLDHLEGKTVSVLGDGIDYGDEIVSSGDITLNHYGNLIHVGLPYDSIVIPMKLHSGSQMGTARGKRQRINKVTACLYETCGGKIGTDINTLLPIDVTAEEGVLINADVDFEFEGNWAEDAEVCIVQDRPYPMTIRGIVPRVSVNED